MWRRQPRPGSYTLQTQMNKSLLIAALMAAGILAACGKKEEAAAPAVETPAPAAAPAADAAPAAPADAAAAPAADAAAPAAPAADAAPAEEKKQ